MGVIDGDIAEEVRRWRAQRLVSAGFSPRDADRIADDPDYDLHALLDLVDRGCPPRLAARILAPLQEPPC